MVGWLRAPTPYALPSFHAELPHNVVVDEALGILLLVSPRRQPRSLALGCAWAVAPRNIEILDEQTVLDMARMHEHLLRSLPVGAGFQTIMTIVPATSVPAWESLRHDMQHIPMVHEQVAALRRGLPHQELTTQARLRVVRTVVTVRVPLASATPRLLDAVRAILAFPARSATRLTAQLVAEHEDALATLRSVRQGVEESLRAAGHQVETLDHAALGRCVAQSLDPLRIDAPVIVPDLPLSEQVLGTEACTIPGGWAFGTQEQPRVATRVLSLHQSASQTYPGLLCATRAPSGHDPLALWQAWPGPLTVCVNVAAVDSGTQKSRLEWKQKIASWHADDSADNALLNTELKTLLETISRTGGQACWARVHIVLWGPVDQLAQGTDEVIRRGRLLGLEFGAELSEGLGSTLFLHTVPLGFDPDWPAEWTIQRARHLPPGNIKDYLPLYGGFRGTARAALVLLNERGEAVHFHPYDAPTNSHIAVSATSGAGKTYLTNLLINNVMSLGAYVVVVDPLTNYRGVGGAWDGDYLTLSYKNPVCFNPFFGALDQEHGATATSAVAEMAGGAVERIAWEEYSVLGGAVAYYMSTWDRQRGEPTMTPFVQEVLEEAPFAKDRRTAQLARSLARKLMLFYGSGQFAGFVDGPNTFTLAKQLTVIELSEFENTPELQGILFFLLLHTVTEFFKHPARRYLDKFLIFDEVFAPLKLPETAKRIEWIVRTYRNADTSACFLSQRPHDYCSPVGEVIRGLAGIKLFLKHDPSDRRVLEQDFQLAPPELEAIAQAQKHATFTSGLLRIGDQYGGRVRIVGDPLTHFLASQDRQTAQHRDALLARTHGNMPAAVRLWQEERAHA
jgi:TraG P-loop domain